MPAIALATINAKWIHPSLALRLLKASLAAGPGPDSGSNGGPHDACDDSLAEQCEILEFALRQPLSEKISSILAAQPRLLALSVSIWNHEATRELLGALEEKWPAGQRPVVVLGGPEVSWLSPDAAIFRHADFVIRGEGEESFRSLCHRLLNGEGMGPETGNEGGSGRDGPVFINEGGSVADIKSIRPAYGFYSSEDLEKKLIYVESARGCPFECWFCQGHGCQAPNSVREFPLEPFLADMGTLIDRGGRMFKFLDRSFNLNMERVKRIMEFFLERMERPLCVHFEMVPSRFPPALRDLLRRFPPGGLRIELGIQTLNEETASLVGRRWSPGEMLETVKFLRHETSAIVHADLIAGLPAEGLGSFGAGFDLLWQALSKPPAGAGIQAPGRFEIQLGILKRLPGAPMARQGGAFGMKYSAAPPYELMESPAMPAADLNMVKNFARFWEIIVNRNSFPELAARLFPPGAPVFGNFMEISGRLQKSFGRNWGIDRAELKACLEKL